MRKLFGMIIVLAIGTAPVAAANKAKSPAAKAKTTQLYRCPSGDWVPVGTWPAKCGMIGVGF